jgi:hypothetical protein
MLTQSMPDRAEMLMEEAQQFVYDRWEKYEEMARAYEPEVEGSAAD